MEMAAAELLPEIDSNSWQPGEHLGKALVLLTGQMRHSFYFIIWDIFKYKRIQNNSEWSPSIPGVSPL